MKPRVKALCNDDEPTEQELGTDIYTVGIAMMH